MRPVTGAPLSAAETARRITERAALRTWAKIRREPEPPVDPTMPGPAVSTWTRPHNVARLTAYQHLVGEPASDVLPGGYLHVLSFPAMVAAFTAPVFPLPLVGLVHVSFAATVLRPVGVGSRLQIIVEPTQLSAHRRGTCVDVETTIVHRGEPVYRGVSVYLAMGTWLAGPAPDELTPPRQRRHLVGLPTSRWQFTPADTRQYASLSGDRNPIHASVLAARALGFSSRIVHGMHSAARALAMCTRRGDSYEWSAQFVKPFPVPGAGAVQLTHQDDTTSITVWNPARQPHVDVQVTRQTGEAASL